MTQQMVTVGQKVVKSGSKDRVILLDFFKYG